jgi:threonine/homoserine/homoserine lactone efflux protein
MAAQKPFNESLGAAWLLFVVVGIILIGGAFGTSWLKTQLAALGLSVWAQALPGVVFMIVGVRLLVRRMR